MQAAPRSLKLTDMICATIEAHVDPVRPTKARNVIDGRHSVPFPQQERPACRLLARYCSDVKRFRTAHGERATQDVPPARPFIAGRIFGLCARRGDSCLARRLDLVGAHAGCALDQYRTKRTPIARGHKMRYYSKPLISIDLYKATHQLATRGPRFRGRTGNFGGH